MTEIKLPTIRSPQELAELINQIGFLPFFANQVEGFSLEEIIAPRYWFPAEGDGAWEWKTPVIGLSDCAYGKFFRGKAGFISKEWFPDYANYRRDGYDFDARYDDGLSRFADKAVYDTLESRGSLLSKELKQLGNFRKDGNKGFDGIITRLQMQGYVVIRAFEYRRDRTGREYGWGVARYETAEYRFGAEFTEQVYRCAPDESKEKILQHLSGVLDGADQKQIQKLIAL